MHNGVMRCAVVGHTEWVEFVRVARVPMPGEIIRSRESWEEPAGGGAMASAELARLSGSCEFFTALGSDERAQHSRERLTALGIIVHSAQHPEPQARTFTYLDDAGERTITLVGTKLRPSGDEPLPWDTLASVEACYFVSGDEAALRQARRARVLVATSRSLPVLANTDVQLDALVFSAHDADEHYQHGMLRVAPRLVIATGGALGGRYAYDGVTFHPYPPVPVPGPVRDAYGAGDSFAAGITYGLGLGVPIEEALRIAATSGATALTRRGAHGKS